MNNFTLITGASKGIGKALANEYAKQKHNLLLIARDGKLLEELSTELQQNHKIKVLTLEKDLTHLGAINSIKDFCTENNLTIDNLINNAGFGDYGRFVEIEDSTISNMIDLNIKSLTLLTHIFLDDITKNKGRIILVSSVASYLPMPLMAVYGATKAFVTSFGVALNEEIKSSGASVTVICPGNTKSQFTEVSGLKKSKLSQFNQSDSQSVAHFTYEQANKRTAIATFGFTNSMTAIFPRLLPQTIQAIIARKALE